LTNGLQESLLGTLNEPPANYIGLTFAAMTKPILVVKFGSAVLAGPMDEPTPLRSAKLLKKLLHYTGTTPLL
jgi:hypothetical protein